MKLSLHRHRIATLAASALTAVLAIGGAPVLAAAQTSSSDNAQGHQLDPAWLEGLGNLESKVIAWRRDFHQHPELSNREVRTAGIVAKHLRALGAEVRTGIAHTGVIALLRGAKPGPTIALRADMDALPVTERTAVPFASKVTTQFRGETVGVMHACGHDAHTAILMGVAELIARERDRWHGQVLFVFQPAEEGAPEGERGGASLMIEDGAFKGVQPTAIFGLHVIASLPTGVIGYRSGPMMTGSDSFTLEVRGIQTHGSRPWGGVDPILAAAQILTGWQSIVSRQTDITQAPVVLSVGAIKGGIRFNIIPDTVEMIGTLRSFDRTMRDATIARMEKSASHIAAASGASASLRFREEVSIPPVINDPHLTAQSLATLRAVVGPEHVREISLQTTAEDFSFYGQHMPAFFFWLGITPPTQNAESAAFNHSPEFFLDESGLRIGMQAMLSLALHTLESAPAAP